MARKGATCFAGLIAIALILQACNDDTGGGNGDRGTEICGANVDCETGSHCGSDSFCLPLTTCQTDADCAYGARCGTGGQCASALSTESYSTGARQPADVLFVIGHTPRDCELQNTLYHSLDAWASWLGDIQADLQIAVITPDVVDLENSGGVFRRAPGEACIVPGTDFDASCDTRVSGVMRTADYALDNPGGQRAFAEDLRCLTHTGSEGSGPPMGLEAMRAALSDPAQAAEFLRPGARLAIVFIVDGVDCSDGTFGDNYGPVYAATLEDGNDLACEYQRNSEDSCPYTVLGNTGSMVTHEGRERLGWVWCYEGDRATIEALATELEVQCPPGGCANALTPRSEYYDFLVDLMAVKNGHGSDRAAAAADIGTVAIVNPNNGTRYDRPDEPPPICFGGRSGYRYTLFTQMFGNNQVATACQPPWSNVFGPNNPILGQPVNTICLDRPPIACNPSLGEAACTPGAACLEQFEFQPESYFACSDAVVRVSVDLGAGPIALTEGPDYRVDYQSQRCLAETGTPVEIRLIADYEQAVTVTVDYFAEP